jgi:hypothetical protein
VLEIAYLLVESGCDLNRILILEYFENVFMEKIVVGFNMMSHKILRIVLEILVDDSP